MTGEGDSQRRMSDRQIRERIEEAQRQAGTIVISRLTPTISGLQSSRLSPVWALPLPRATLVGPYTDTFGTDAGLSSIYRTSCDTPSGSEADGELRITATSFEYTSWCHAYCGRETGAYVPLETDWTITAAVEGVTALHRAAAGFGVASGDAANGIEWLETGSPAVVCYRVEYNDNDGHYYAVARVGGTDAGNQDYADLGTTPPSSSNPIYLKLAYVYGAVNHEFTFTYKIAGGSWQAHYTRDVAHATVDWDAYLDVSLMACQDGKDGIDVGTFVATFSSITVDYSPAGAPNDYAFIPTSSFSGYAKDHYYGKRDDGTYQDVTLQEGMVWRSLGRFYEYDVTNGIQVWGPPHGDTSGRDAVDSHPATAISLDTTDFSHILSTEDEVQAAIDTLEDFKPTINSGDDMVGIAGGTENRIVTLDANALPKDSGFAFPLDLSAHAQVVLGEATTDDFASFNENDALGDSGYSAASFAAAAHTHDARYYTETELDSGQLDNRYYTETEVDALTWDASDIASGTLVHERGGLEADVNAYDGLLKISGGVTSAITDSSSDWDDAHTHVSSDGTDHGYIDQDVQASASPAFAGLDLNGNLDMSTAGYGILIKDNNSVALLIKEGANPYMQFGTLNGSEKISLYKELYMTDNPIRHAEYLELDEITTPTPAAGYGKVYTQSDNVLYFQDGMGTEHAVTVHEEFILAAARYWGSTNSVVYYDGPGYFPVAHLGNTSSVYITFHLPAEFHTLLVAEIVIIPDATETIQWDIHTHTAAEGEAYDTHVEDALDEQQPVTAGEITALDVSGVLTLLTAGDYVGMKFEADTNYLNIVGLRLRWI